MALTEAFIFIYIISILWMALGGIIGHFMFKHTGGVIVMQLLFGVMGILIFPGMWELV